MIGTGREPVSHAILKTVREQAVDEPETAVAALAQSA